MPDLHDFYAFKNTTKGSGGMGFGGIFKGMSWAAVIYFFLRIAAEIL